MRKSIIKQLERKGMYDTRNYRYIMETDVEEIRIYRIKIAYLDTTAAIDGQELVKMRRCD